VGATIMDSNVAITSSFFIRASLTAVIGVIGGG
jgi:hypothetical protein